MGSEGGSRGEVGLGREQVHGAGPRHLREHGTCFHWPLVPTGKTSSYVGTARSLPRGVFAMLRPLNLHKAPEGESRCAVCLRKHGDVIKSCPFREVNTIGWSHGEIQGLFLRGNPQGLGTRLKNSLKFVEMSRFCSCSSTLESEFVLF